MKIFQNIEHSNLLGDVIQSNVCVVLCISLSNFWQQGFALSVDCLCKCGTPAHNIMILYEGVGGKKNKNTVVVLLGFPKGIKVSIAQGAQPRGQY